MAADSADKSKLTGRRVLVLVLAVLVQLQYLNGFDLTCNNAEGGMNWMEMVS
jgi:hypothetical protein